MSEQQPQQTAGLTYAKGSLLQSYIHNPPQHGRVLVRVAATEQDSVSSKVSFAGMLGYVEKRFYGDALRRNGTAGFVKSVFSWTVSITLIRNGEGEQQQPCPEGVEKESRDGLTLREGLCKHCLFYNSVYVTLGGQWRIESYHGKHDRFDV